MRSGRWSETEITKSLRTGNLKEAQYRARLERVKLDGEWAVLRRQLAPKPVGTVGVAGSCKYAGTLPLRSSPSYGTVRLLS